MGDPVEVKVQKQTVKEITPPMQDVEVDENNPFMDIDVDLKDITFDDLVMLEEYGNGERADIKGMRDILNRFVVGGVGSVKLVDFVPLMKAVMHKIGQSMAGADQKN